MQALFTDFRNRLRVLRKQVETSRDFDMACIKAILDEDIFNDRIILYRIEEYEETETFSKQSLLRFLSLWECSLSDD